MDVFQVIREALDHEYQRKLKILETIEIQFQGVEIPDFDMIGTGLFKKRELKPPSKPVRGEKRIIECELCKKERTFTAGEYNARVKINKGKPPRFCSKSCAQKGKHNKNTPWAGQASDFTQKLREDVLKAHPVRTLKDMSPAEQAEMQKLYGKKEPSDV